MIAETSKRGMSVDNDDVTRALLPYFLRRIPLRHYRARGQGHEPQHWADGRSPTTCSQLLMSKL